MLIQSVSSNTVAAPPPDRPAIDGASASAVSVTNAVVNPTANVTANTQSAAPVQAPPPPQPTASELKSMVDGINRALQQSNKNVEFSVDSSTKATVIKLVDSQSGDVIRQFPSEAMLELSKAIGQMQEQLQQAALAKTPPPDTPSLLLKQQA